LLAAGATLPTWPLPARAQPKSALPRIGYLNIESADVNGVFLDALRDGLRELGYVDGKNIVIDVRWADGFAPALPQLAATLVKEKPDAIVTTCIPSTRAAKQATGTLPVVMSVDGDPVAAGLVASLARPGANVTGTSTLFEELIPKWLELLTTAAPKVHDIAILRNPGNVADPYFWGRFEEAAKAKGVKVLPFEGRHQFRSRSCLCRHEPAARRCPDRHDRGLSREQGATHSSAGEPLQPAGDLRLS
jgi:putative ABC transport system substrate-binding protein